MDALLSKTEAAEECPGGLVLGLGDGSDALASQLHKWIAEDCTNGPWRSPSRRRGDKRHINIRLPVIVVDRNRYDLSIMSHAYRYAWSEV